MQNTVCSFLFHILFIKWLTVIILKQWFESQIIRISISYDDFLRMSWYIWFVIVSIYSFSLISANVYFNSIIAFKNFSREYVFKMRLILICIIQFFILILNSFVICWSRFQRVFFYYNFWRFVCWFKSHSFWSMFYIVRKRHNWQFNAYYWKCRSKIDRIIWNVRKFI